MSTVTDARMYSSGSQDISVRISVPSGPDTTALLVSAERRISLGWTIATLKAKLQPVTGIPPTYQNLRVRDASGSWVQLDDDGSQVGDSRWALRRGVEIEASSPLYIATQGS